MGQDGSLLIHYDVEGSFRFLSRGLQHKPAERVTRAHCRKEAIISWSHDPPRPTSDTVKELLVAAVFTGQQDQRHGR